MTLELETEVGGIGDLLRRYRFSVPDHQRSYAWSEDEVQDLWGDVLEAMEEEPDGYFLGQIVLGTGDAESDRREIIDGQQRLATVTLIYGAIVATLRSRVDIDPANEQRADEIDRDFVATKNKLTLERTHKVQLGPLDNPFFENLLTASATSGIAATSERTSHRRLEGALAEARAQIESFAPKSKSDSLKRLLQLSDYLQKNVLVIAVNAGSEDNAYLIFETLNDRGVQLTPADLLKNLLFARAGDKLRETQQWWTTMTGTLEALPEQPSPITLFIRHYIISTTEHVRDKQLYKNIKASKTTPTQIVRFVHDLAAEAEQYVALVNSQSGLWVNEVERDAIRTIGIFKARTVRPLLLAISKRRPSKERTALLHQTMKSTIRLAISARLGRGPTEEGMGAAARSVRGGTVTSAARLRRALGGADVNDADFEATFLALSIKNSRQARCLLRGLEIQVRQDKNDSNELAPEIDEAKVNLEHVLPRNPADGTWSAFSADQVDLYAHRLGNQVLLNSALNKALKAGEYSAKEATLADSELHLTAEAAGKSGWSIEEIEGRQKRLAAVALRVW